MNNLVIVRGGGDIATGIIYRLKQSGFSVVLLEVSQPSSIRRKVCFSEAVYEGRAVVEEVEACLMQDVSLLEDCFRAGKIPVFVDPQGELIEKLKPEVVVDAILAKQNLGTHLDMAPITIGIGPGFQAGKDVLAVVETMRGNDLGRVYYQGIAMPNTGVPGMVGGYSKERVIHSPWQGRIVNLRNIGERVSKGEPIATINGQEIIAPIDGILRGLIREGYPVSKGLKIADIDPRLSEQKNCFRISDKARAVGGGVLEAILHLRSK